MGITGSRPSRRTLLALGAGTALATALPSSARADGPTAARPEGIEGTARIAGIAGIEGIAGRLRELEAEHNARLGVYAHSTETGATVLHRADERFPMCSVFKTLAVAAVLRDLDHDGEVLSRRIFYTLEDVSKSGNSPVTMHHVADGMTVAELCDAAITQSDNTAANLLLRLLGGPTAITRFCRSTGDAVTRLDRWEPALNTAEPWRVTDTTTPHAIGRTYARLTLGNVLAPGDRQRLTAWMLANTTNKDRFRAGVPADWAVADKTGGGEYGTSNDVGLVRPPERPPIVMAVLTTHHDPEAKGDNALIAETVRLLARSLA
ncbi:class A beta-lactamase [Streptomyces sp. URMC 127]|uniref:class A beta-lactamase n=1 Tax=Streptomyces sp. URMC 127 TaxID=3423402 RepID=UPI003F1D5A5E